MGATVAEWSWTGLADLERELRAFLGRRCRDENELDDIVQETFLRAARFRRSVQDTRNLRGWTMRIGGNVLRDRQRRESRQPRQAASGGLELEGLDDARRTPERAVRMGGRWVEREEAVGILREAVADLARHDRAVLEAYYEGERSTPEIARELGLPRELVKVRLFRARKRLSRRLEAAGWSSER